MPETTEQLRIPVPVPGSQMNYGPNEWHIVHCNSSINNHENGLLRKDSFTICVYPQGQLTSSISLSAIVSFDRLWWAVPFLYDYMVYDVRIPSIDEQDLKPT